MVGLAYGIWDNDKQVDTWRDIGKLYETSIEILGELIQNSVRIILEADIKGAAISIEIDLESNLFTVKDNAGGFTTLSHLGLTQSEHEDQDGGSGFGVGLNAVISSSDYFRLETYVHDQDKSGVLEIFDFYKTSTNDSLSDEQKKREISEKIKSKSAEKPAYTQIDIKMREDFFEALQSEFEQMDSPMDLVDKIKLETPLGFTSSLFGSENPEITVDFSIKDAAGVEVVLDVDFGFSGFNHISDDVYKIHDTLDKKDTGSVSSDDILYYRKITDPDESGLILSVVGYCVNGTHEYYPADERWDKNFHQDIISRGSDRRIFLSINGFLQSFNVPQLKWSSAARCENWTTLVIQTNQNVVDIGRNTMSKGLKERIAKEARAAALAFNAAITKGTSSQNHVVNKAYIAQKVKDSNTHKKIERYVQNVGIIKPRSILLNPPTEEQEAVALFLDMVSKKFIDDLSFISVSGSKAYDFLIRYTAPLSKVGKFFSTPMLKLKDVSEETRYCDIPGNEVVVGEAKLHASDLVKNLVDISNSKKDYQIHLGVSWDTGTLTAAEDKVYRIKPCPIHKRLHPTVTHIIEKVDDTDIFIPLIVLDRHVKLGD